MSIDEICSGPLCERAFDLISVGAPSIIALFLIIYAHKTLSTRLKEASESKQHDNARTYRVILYGVWGVALVLMVSHAGIFAWRQLSPDQGGEKGFVAGAFRELDSDRAVDLESQPERLYVRNVPGDDNRYWIIRGTSQLQRETFKIASEGMMLFCPVDMTALNGEPPSMVELKLDRDSGHQPPAFKLKLLPSHQRIAWKCETLVDNLPPVQPSNGAPLDAFDAAEPDGSGAREGGQQGWLAPLLGIGRAYAGAGFFELEQVLRGLNDDDYRTWRAARAALAEQFENYREWATEVALAEAAYQAGKSRYFRPTYRERLGLVHALALRHQLPRDGMFEPVDLDEAVVEFALEQALSEDRNLQAAAKRFVISYPGDAMAARLDRLWAHQQLEPGARQLRARELLAHFLYNRGILVTLAHRDHLDGAVEPDLALAALKRAEELAGELPPEARFEFAKVSYGIGWAHVVGHQEGFGPAFSLDEGRAAFEHLLQQVGGRQEEYPFEWQLRIAEAYLRDGDYGVFNK